LFAPADDSNLGNNMSNINVINISVSNWHFPWELERKTSQCKTWFECCYYLSFL